MIRIIKAYLHAIIQWFKIKKLKWQCKRYLKERLQNIIDSSFPQTATGESLDRLVNLYDDGVEPIYRIGWDRLKDIPKGQPYRFNINYGYPGECKYEETDESLRKRIAEHIKKNARPYKQNNT